MTQDPRSDARLARHLTQMQSDGLVPMTVEEILAGETQAGVPRPAFLRDDDDDGTVERVGKAAETGK